MYPSNTRSPYFEPLRNVESDFKSVYEPCCPKLRTGKHFMTLLQIKKNFRQGLTTI